MVGQSRQISGVQTVPTQGIEMQTCGRQKFGRNSPGRVTDFGFDVHRQSKGSIGNVMNLAGYQRIFV
jgi:hypothetical protein